MVPQPSDPDHVTERCGTCEGKTTHDVRVEIRTESQQEENAEFSREPYRITTCSECGAETTTRMNNA
ncbi:hypothetical protein GRX01_09650 [Halobaculum sp. WSA2]|uniref:DUF7835 domain-containing protein n=1 Tax=Halobaculum saliterrae TaxID=2073113 RepID=A0A6B0T051_9EURY|nr:hypothetical protein [Halobaculum saliterrae]MXR41600.1 hypothetical protein [Halobaculum saliterrae]